MKILSELIAALSAHHPRKKVTVNGEPIVGVEQTEGGVIDIKVNISLTPIAGQRSGKVNDPILETHVDLTPVESETSE